MEIGKKLIELRKKSGCTQEKIAEKIGISRQTLSNWESDITTPDLNQANKLCEIYKIKITELLDDKTEIVCKDNSKMITKDLLNKKCFLDLDEEEYKINYDTPCKVLDINDNFIKIEFSYGKEKIIKLVDLNLISSIKYYKEDN